MFDLTMNAFAKEIVKLCLQFAGALLIARLTVSWALGRFKTEKSWERKVTAMADVLSALREMLRVLSIWEDREIRKASENERYEAELRQRWQTAEEKFKEVSSVAILVLPQEVADRIEALEKALANRQHESWFDEIEANSVAISAAMTWLVDHAKEYRS